MGLRIYADFNSGGSPGHGPCWLLRYGDPKRPLDEVAAQLSLLPGMGVTLFYEDPAEEFEVAAVLEQHVEPTARARWQALPDWRTYRLIRGTMSSISDHRQPWEVAVEASAERLAGRPKRKISRTQLAVFLAYEGNGDLYQIRKRPDPDMFDGAWGTISSLLQQMGTAESGLASTKFRAEVEAELEQLTEDGATRDLLRVLILNRQK